MVLLQEEDDWLPYFSTKTTATVVEVLEGMADRGSEEVAHEQYPSSNILPDRHQAG